MNDPIDIQGIWWLPETPDHKVPGWLHYNDTDGGELRLAGSLHPPQWIENRVGDQIRQRLIREPERLLYPRIHGQSGRQLFNLEDSFRINIQRHLCRDDDSAETVHVNWLLTGAWFDGDENIELDKATLQVQHLTDWVGHSGLRNERRFDEPNPPFAQITAHNLATFRTPIDGGELAIWHGLATDGDGRNNLTLKQGWGLTITPDQTSPIGYFTDLVSDFQALVTIATGEVANIESFHFNHNEVPQLSGGGTPIGNRKEKLRFYTRWANRDTNDTVLSPHAMVFAFEDLGGIDGVGRWMQFARTYRSELSRVMATRYNQHMFVEDRVMNCVATLESFDRTRNNEKHGDTYLVDRLRRCVKYAGEPFTDLLGGEPIEQWTTRAKDSRHILGHHFDAFRQDTGIVERDLTDQLFWLAALCFLRQAEAPNAVFQKISTNRNFRWVAERATTRHQTTTHNPE